jgi:hypothetical protein
LTLTAASSIASGSPSNLWQIRDTVDRVRVRKVECGHDGLSTLAEEFQSW